MKMSSEVTKTQAQNTPQFAQQQDPRQSEYFYQNQPQEFNRNAFQPMRSPPPQFENNQDDDFLGKDCIISFFDSINVPKLTYRYRWY